MEEGQGGAAVGQETFVTARAPLNATRLHTRLTVGATCYDNTVTAQPGDMDAIAAEIATSLLELGRTKLRSAQGPWLCNHRHRLLASTLPRQHSSPQHSLLYIRKVEIINRGSCATQGTVKVASHGG